MGDPNEQSETNREGRRMRVEILVLRGIMNLKIQERSVFFFPVPLALPFLRAENFAVEAFHWKWKTDTRENEKTVKPGNVRDFLCFPFSSPHSPVPLS